MVKTEVLSEEPMTMADVKKSLSDIKERDTELSFRGQKTEDYLNSFHVLDVGKATELRKKLEGLKVPRLREMHIAKIIDLLPGSVQEVKNLLQGYTITVSADNVKKIVKAVDDFRPEETE